MSSLLNLLYIYDPWLFHFLRMSFLVGVAVLLWIGYKLYKRQLNNFIIPKDSIFVLIGLIILSVIPLLINGSRELSVVAMYCRLLIMFVFGIGIYNVFYSNINGKEKLISDIKNGIIIQAIIGLFALCSIQLFIGVALNSHILLPRFYGSEQEYRLFNFTSSAFFQLSLFYLFLLHFLLAYNNKTDKLSGFYIFLILFIGVISGRTFFTFSILSILIYFKLRYIPWLILFTIIVLFLSIYCQDNIYVAHAFEPIINLIKYGTLESSSTDTLMKKHLFIPELKQLIMGDGHYFTPEGHYYGGSDSGFIRQALYGGLGYSLVCFLFTAYFVKRVAENWLENSWLFTLSTLFILSILNIKADTYAFPGLMLVLLMFLSLFSDNNNQREKKVILFQREK
ncbi:MAG: hypothetical protein Q4A81_00815 [Pasteurellaceae bacterium]|nr:hypothetical protein [Pasteurellaceae bacterium]